MSDVRPSVRSDFSEMPGLIFIKRISMIAEAQRGLDALFVSGSSVVKEIL